jgi:hypothetical protein
MKSLRESILDDDIEQRSDDAVELHKIWEDLTVTYGSMLKYWDIFGCTVDNIAFDKKGRIIFVNWPMREIEFDMQISGMPDSVLKRGFGEFKCNVSVQGMWGSSKGGTKLSSLGFVTPSKTELSIKNSKVEFDICPKFKEVQFWECFITNPMKLPKIQPKNCKLIFNEGTVSYIGCLWAKEFFKTDNVQFGGKLIVEK